MRFVLPALVLGLSLSGGVSSVIAAGPSNPCLSAIQKYGVPQGVPVKVLYGISRVESNFNPWALNLKGRSWFGTSRQQTKNMVLKLIKQGHRSFDVGCMQMNVYWHHKRFASVDQIIDPSHNVYQASRFLRELKREFGSWPKAVAAYHSRKPVRGQAYLRSVIAALPITTHHYPSLPRHYPGKGS